LEQSAQGSGSVTIPGDI